MAGSRRGSSEPNATMTTATLRYLLGPRYLRSVLARRPCARPDTPIVRGYSSPVATIELDDDQERDVRREFGEASHDSLR
jgi:hypothetical protein